MNEQTSLVPNQKALEKLAASLGQALIARGWTLACVESCTGGWAAQACTAIAGSSSWFDRGFVTYSNAAKQDMLGVRAQTLQAFGAVSEATAREMVMGALGRSQAQAAFAITGIAGPTGATVEKPVGMVCFAWQLQGLDPVLAQHVFSGDRHAVRAQAVAMALQNMRELVQKQVQTRVQNPDGCNGQI